MLVAQPAQPMVSPPQVLLKVRWDVEKDRNYPADCLKQPDISATDQPRGELERVWRCGGVECGLDTGWSSGCTVGPAPDRATAAAAVTLHTTTTSSLAF